MESHLIPPPSLHDRKGSSFPGLVPSDGTVNSESVMGIKPDDSGVVIHEMAIIGALLNTDMNFGTDFSHIGLFSWIFTPHTLGSLHHIFGFIHTGSVLNSFKDIFYHIGLVKEVPFHVFFYFD